ncbi:hypothetical protein FJZ31_03735 [Candidatus Poribacteria bacterium]|nr:hypothetical protein [Candidatus Poribacteria bacterium]
MKPRTVWICMIMSFILSSQSGWGGNDFLFLEQTRVIHETAFKNSSEGKLVFIDGSQGYSFDTERKQLRYNLDPAGGYAFVTELNLDACEAILGRTIIFDGMKRYQRAKLVSFDPQNRIQKIDSYVPLDLFHGQNSPLSQDRVEVIQVDVDGTVTLLYNAQKITLIPGQSTQFEQKLSFPIQQQLLEGQPELVRDMYKNVVSVSYVIEDTFTNWGWTPKINMTNERYPRLVGDILYYVSERGNQYNFYQYDIRTQVTQYLGTITDPLLGFDASSQLIVGIRDNNLLLYALDLLSLNKLDIEPKVDHCRVWNSQILWRDEEGNLYLYDAQSGKKKHLGLATIRITPQIYF